MRRNLPIIYIIEDNGCYGLTKGQFSPTADLGSKLKNGVVNDLPPIDTCALAVELGATFVARSFSGDKKQLLALLKASLAHRGTVLLDVLSPCVTFNDHEGSTKSYTYVKDHDEPLETSASFRFSRTSAWTTSPERPRMSTMHDGSKLLLRKLEEDYDPTDKIGALKRLAETARRGEFATGLIYIEPDRDDFLMQLNVVDEPLASLPLERVRPSREALEEIMERFADAMSPMIERTLAIIKPDAVERGVAGRIIQRIEGEGFGIRAIRHVRLSKQQAQGFYAVHHERPFFDSLTTSCRRDPRSCWSRCAGRDRKMAHPHGRHRSGEGRGGHTTPRIRHLHRAQRDAWVGCCRIRRRSRSDTFSRA